MGDLMKPSDALEPIVLGCYTLAETGLEVRGKPTYEEHVDVGGFIDRAVRSSGFWKADWIAYGERRPDFQKRLDADMGIEQMSEQSIRQYRYIAKAVPPKNRVEGVPFGHHAEVASLEQGEQRGWLEKARDEGWTQRELRQEIRAAKRTKVISGQAALEGMFRIIYADCPWLYSDSGATADGSLGKAERHYAGMTIDELCKLPVGEHALPNSVLFMWTTVPLSFQNPGPREVFEAWGFTYKTHRVWDKVLGMPGHYGMDVTHELLLICTRGDGMPDVPTPHEKSVYTERRTNEHSAKPEEVRRWIQKHWTRGPYLELFGRKPVEGWSVFGNDARLWAEEMAS